MSMPDWRVESGVNNSNSILATAKHFVGDGATEWGTGDNGYQIDQGDVRISEAEIRKTALIPYLSAIQANVATIMASFSSINGKKMHASRYWLTDVLKKELGFKGFVVSDWAAIRQIAPGDYPKCVRDAINAGIDMVMIGDISGLHQLFISTLKKEVESKRVSMTRIDNAVLRILEAKYKMGLFDRPFADRSLLSTVGSVAHRALAREAVGRSMVLLKKDVGANFPLSRTGSYKIAVAGSGADDIGLQCGGWTISWQGKAGKTTVGTTILQGLKNGAAKNKNIKIEYSVDGKIKSNADVGIVVVAEKPYAEGDGDSSNLALPQKDLKAIDNLCGKVATCIVVVLSGRPVLITDRLSKAQVWIAAFLPGSEGGGVADVIYGMRPFTGKLTTPWPKSLTNLKSGTATWPALFPAGHGLS